ncbi:late embryogenesis abundant protein At1g64065-like [Macadamia integrifolia]|uniref:late embryogenesis abundant protein At1g64065-like n=1 Tax=Macadamia integrifolia TaxID=60698 RepID=UPI001C52AF0A|nr:late embryogenesis abundant protein At1g64065-like [Macadamia integrifolia]
MVEEDQARPFAYATTPTVTGDEEATSLQSQRKLRRKKFCICYISVSLVIGLVLPLVLIFTVFKVKKPTMTLNSVQFEKVSISNSTSLAGIPSLNPTTPTTTTTSTNPSINMTMLADMSVKNPNVASFKFKPGTTILYYYGSEAGVARNPAGNAKAKKTMHMNLTIDLYIQADSSTPSKLEHLTSDLKSGEMSMDSYTILDGRVNVLNIFKKNVEIKMNCTMTLAISSGSPVSVSLKDMQCKSKVKL